MTDFEQKMKNFIYGLEHIFNNNRARPNRVVANDGKRYIKIVTEDTDPAFKGQSAYCFIDKENGDVLKPASWRAPAKHARGNIFDSSNGLACCGPYGVAYLR